MQYETIKSNEIDFTFESKNFSSIFGLYLFSLGAVFSGYSIYLLLEAVGESRKKYYYLEWSRPILVFNFIFYSIIYFVYTS